jgi:hypothetical protein
MRTGPIDVHGASMSIEYNFALHEAFVFTLKHKHLYLYCPSFFCFHSRIRDSSLTQDDVNFFLANCSQPQATPFFRVAATVQQCDEYNKLRVEELKSRNPQAKHYEFMAVDSNDEPTIDLRQSSGMQKKLALVVGAKVITTDTIGKSICRGTIGYVADIFEDKYVMVQFDQHQTLTKVQRHTWKQTGTYL